MQHILLTIQNDQEEVKFPDINLADVFNVATKDLSFEELKKTYPLLASIDPYGYTLFNASQIFCLKEELHRLNKTLNAHKEIQLIISKFLNVLREHVSKNTSVKFYGD